MLLVLFSDLANTHHVQIVCAIDVSGERSDALNECIIEIITPLKNELIAKQEEVRDMYDFIVDALGNGTFVLPRQKQCTPKKLSTSTREETHENIQSNVQTNVQSNVVVTPPRFPTSG